MGYSSLLTYHGHGEKFACTYTYVAIKVFVLGPLTMASTIDLLGVAFD